MQRSLCASSEAGGELLKTIPYGRQSINQDDIDAVTSVLRSDWLTQGPKVREFEEALCRQCGAKHCIVVANGTMALHIACLALDIGPVQVGLTSPISFMASANSIAYCGGTPDFVDIDPKTLCLSPEKVAEYCETRQVPKVVIPVDFAGIPADLPRFKELSEKYGFRLIEDAAHAIGSTYKHNGFEHTCGSCAHTDIAIFSFHPVKTITTGEGGAILANDDDLAQRVRLLANHGIEKNPSRFANPKSEIPARHLPSLQAMAGGRNPKSFSSWYHEMQLLGLNGRITDVQCALGLSQLKRLDEFKARRQEIVTAYNKAFKELEEQEILILPPWPERADPCYHLYPLRLGPRCPINRDELFERLKEQRIHCQVHYIPIYRQPFYKERYDYPMEHFPEAEAYFSRCFSLPLYPDMDEETIQYVVETTFSLL